MRLKSKVFHFLKHNNLFLSSDDTRSGDKCGIHNTMEILFACILSSPSEESSQGKDCLRAYSQQVLPFPFFFLNGQPTERYFSINAVISSNENGFLNTSLTPLFLISFKVFTSEEAVNTTILFDSKTPSCLSGLTTS